MKEHTQKKQNAMQLKIVGSSARDDVDSSF